MRHCLVRKESRFSLQLEEPANAQRPIEFSKEKQNPRVDRFVLFAGATKKSLITREFAVRQIIGGYALRFTPGKKVGRGRKKTHVRIEIERRAFEGQRHDQRQLFACRMAIEIALQSCRQPGGSWLCPRHGNAGVDTF